jgi:AcrR family transcriptional regulator
MATPKQVERHGRILKAGLREFCKCGYHQANVDAIADAGNVGKGTIYRHYKNKEGLFLAVFDWVLKGLEKAIRSKADFSNFEKGSRTAIKTYLQEITSNPDIFHFFRLFTSDHHLEDHALRQKLVDKYLHSSLWTAEETKKAQKLGVVRKNIDPEKLSYAILGMIHFIVYQWNRENRKSDLVKNTDMIADLLFSGILTGAAPKSSPKTAPKATPDKPEKKAEKKPAQKAALKAAKKAAPAAKAQSAKKAPGKPQKKGKK